MSTTQLTGPADSPAAASPTVADMLGETVDLLCFVALYGPPLVFVAAPLVLLALVLIGPFLVIVTLVAAVVVATALIAAVVAILATPFLLLRGRRAARVSAPRPATVQIPIPLWRIAL